MIDMRVLIDRLEEYCVCFDRHLQAVAHEFDSVDRAWRALDECYAGTAADEFRPVWQAAERRFIEYVEQTTAINKILGDRIEHLRSADRPGSLPG